MLKQIPQVEVKDEVWSATTVHCIIGIHKNKAKLKCLRTKQDGKSEVEKVNGEDEDEKEEEEVPQKCKQQSKEGGLWIEKSKIL